MNSNNISEKKPLPWKKIIIGTVVILVVIIIIGALAGGSGGTNMEFKTIGTKGATVFVTLVSPSYENVSQQDLANRLKQDWQYKDICSIFVFDNEAAPQQYIAAWDTFLTMSDQEGAAFDAQVNPHFIAEYERNTNTGLNDVLFFSRDAEHNIVQTIKF
jgi:hypothetical protein